MRDFLLSTLTDEERAYANRLREDPALPEDQFAKELFANLRDPLLSASDLAEIWGAGATAKSFEAVLEQLVNEGLLDASTRTQRPFDDQGTKLYRRSDGQVSQLTLNAIESKAPDGESRYQFSLEARLIRDIARIDRLDALAGSGNQRQEIRAHVNRIREGLVGGTHIPNSVLLVFAEATTQFVDVGDEIPADLPASFVIVRALEDFDDVENSDGDIVQRSRIVQVIIPWRRAAFDEEKSILLVDGQQRTAAASLVSYDDVPFIDVGVSAVVNGEEEAKRVFQVANETVKISTDFSKALLASMADAPGYLKDEQVIAEVVRLLVLDRTESPFYQIVRYPGAAVESPVIAYNTMFGVVRSFRNSLPDDLANDTRVLADIIAKAFSQVADTWQAAWGKKPKESRLMHGAGLRAIAQVVIEKLQNYLSEGYELNSDDVWSKLRSSLDRLSSQIVWTPDEFSKGTQTQKKNWMEEIMKRQNTNQDIAALTTFLTRTSVSLDMKAARSK